MLRSSLVRRRVFAAACAGAALGLCAAPARAKESKRTICTAAYSTYKDALAREKAGEMREARELLSTCAQATVCAGLAPKCTARYNDLALRMPSIVPVVTDTTGAAVLDVEVKVDGAVVTRKLDGRGLPVDAGGHEFTFSNHGQVFATKVVLVVEGERNRRVEVSLGGPPAPVESRKAAPDVPGPVKTAAVAPPPEDSGTEKSEAVSSERVEPKGDRPKGDRSWALPSSPLPYVAAIAGLGGVVAGGMLTYWGNKDNDLAKAQCNHLCPQSTADHIRATYVAADISFGVGVVGLGVATWLFASSHSSEAKAQPRSAYGLGVQPTSSGGFVSLSGDF